MTIFTRTVVTFMLPKEAEKAEEFAKSTDKYIRKDSSKCIKFIKEDNITMELKEDYE